MTYISWFSGLYLEDYFMYKAVTLAGGIREPLLTCSSILLPHCSHVAPCCDWDLLGYELHYAPLIYPTVSTTRPEKCDIFAQLYQSQPITTKFQKHCLYFINLQKPCQNISLSEYFAKYFKCCIPYNSKY